jgi:hypothetical protein
MHRIAFVFSLLISGSALAAPMARVIAIRDSRTVTIDRRGVAADIRLAGVLVAPAHAAEAVAWMNSVLTGSWVMIETDAAGEAYLYRSPDALFINGELARGAYAVRNTTPMVYVGEVNPGPPRQKEAKGASPRRSARPAVRPRARSARGGGRS